MKFQSLSDYYDDHAGEYDKAKATAFAEMIALEAENYADRRIGADLSITVEGFAEELENEFEFPDEQKWMEDGYQSMIDGYWDSKYEEDKDKRMGLD